MGYISDTRNIKYVLAHLESRLHDLENTSSQLQSLIETETDIENIRTAAQLLLNQVIEFNMYWTNYTNTYREAVEEDITDEKNKREQAEQEAARYKAALSQAVKQLKVYQSQAIDLALVNRANKLFDILDENIKAVAVSYSIKQQPKERKGESNHHFNQSVKTEDLIQDYIASGYKVTQAMANKYGMTRPGIKNRLIDAGVYVGRQPK